MNTIFYDAKALKNNRSENSLNYIKDRLSDYISSEDNLSIWLDKKDRETVSCKIKLVSPVYGVIFVGKKGQNSSAVVQKVINIIKKIRNKNKFKKYKKMHNNKSIRLGQKLNESISDREYEAI